MLAPGSSWLVLLLSKVVMSAGFTLAGTAAVERLGPRVGGLGLPVMAILHSHYGREVIEAFFKIFPAGIFGVCLFNLVVWLALQRLDLGLTIVLGYAVDIAYLVAVAWVRGRSR